jgi:hypothetical protein
MWAYSRIGLPGHRTTEAASHSQSIFWASVDDHGSYPTLLPLFYIVPAKRKRALVGVRRLKPRDIFMTIVQRVPY